jgi:2-polyprenyl-3-methyl-5-hydroxy-6-metoxy-1,4-benzoquinol methylase
MLIERAVEGLHQCVGDAISRRAGAADQRVLDIGCGTGAWLSRLHTNGWSQLTGIDYDPPDSISGIRFERFDLNTDDPGSIGAYDLITCIEVIEHLENVGRLLDLVKEALSQNGLFILTTPNVESLRARIRSLLKGELPSFDVKSDPTHLFPILHQTLVKLLARRNMRIVDVLQYPLDPRESKQFRGGITKLSNLARLVLADPLYGDNSVYLISHN